LTIVITTCTNRKRKPVSQGLHAASLAVGHVADVANEWGHRLRQPAQLFPVMEVYGGRSFQEAKAVAERLDADVFVISAGLGLVDASEAIPAYACTVLDGAEDGIEPKVLGGFSSMEWWAHLKRVSPFSRDLLGVVANAEGRLVLAALSDSYIRMLSEDLMALADERLARLRLFTRAPLDRIPARLRPFVMPYDDRLDGPASPIKGTRSDFAGRALRHFSDYILPGAEDGLPDQHIGAVRKTMEDWPFPSMAARQRLTDDEILALLHEHWEAARGSSSALLRVFRDQLNVACEQGRFASLARQVRAELS
jgi:hypothetical protein